MNNKRKDIIPNNLKEFRKNAGLTQKQVAKVLGHAFEDRICLWEQGKNIPNILNVLKLSFLYRATLTQLYPELATRMSEEVESAKYKDY